MSLDELFSRYLDLTPPPEPLDGKALPGTGGVCALTDDHGRLIQVLAAENLRRFLVHRFEPPTDQPRRGRADLRAIARRLWWQPTHSTFETALTYLDIARRLNPTGYRKDLAFGPVWFARINLQDEHPRWICDPLAFTPPTVDVGPFETRLSCRRFIELLEDLFDLCRYHEVLRQAPHGVACAYQEMGKCPAPCDGSISMAQYCEALVESIDFATGRSELKMARLEAAMVAAAEALQFERATRIRQQIATANKVLAADGRFQPTPQRFRYLVIQRGGGSSRIKPFFVDRGVVGTDEAATLSRLGGVVERWTDKMRTVDADNEGDDSVRRSEQIGLVCHFLAKGPRAPGLFLHQSELGTPGNLADTIKARFGKKAVTRRNQPVSVDPPRDGPLQ
ncbi:MAG: UvrB/UvrC motif-containing protein [Planctomycetes bacterium]|nr:UvrB/UvrC motif-containing protein [Planctomycetota bacterium]